MPNTPDIERIGVSKLETLFSQVGWKFREQPIKDFGIDAQVEMFDNNNPSGKLIAIQIKSGLSYFGEETDDTYVFRPKPKHVEYWTNHCLPVIIVLYKPDSEQFYWAKADMQFITSTGKGFKIEISKRQILDISNIRDLATLYSTPLHEQKMHRLVLESQWMRIIESGTPVYARCFDWINKSLSRTSISLWYHNGTDEIGIDLKTIYCPGIESLDILNQTFSWAEFYIDDEVREKYLNELYESECYGHYDKEEDQVIYTQDYDEWLEEQVFPDIIPYENHYNEAIEYRFRVKLNELGKAALLVLDHVYTPTHLDVHGFRL